MFGVEIIHRARFTARGLISLAVDFLQVAELNVVDSIIPSKGRELCKGIEV